MLSKKTLCNRTIEWLVLLATICWSGTAARANWHEYPCGTTPTTATPAWAVYSAGSDTYITGSDYNAMADMEDVGYLQLNTLSPASARCSYQYSGANWNPTDEFTIRFRARVLSNVGYTTAFQLFGGGTTSRFSFSLNQTSAKLGTNTITIDATEWHVYCITGTRNGGAWSYTLSVDNDAATAVTYGGEANTDNRILFGDTSTSTSVGGRVHIDYIDWDDQQAFLPPKRPWHASYDGDALPTVAVPAWTQNYSANSYSSLASSGGVSYLRISSGGSTSDRPSYTYTGGTGTDWEVVNEFSYEIRARVVSHAGYMRAGSVLLHLLDGNVARLYFHDNSVGFVTTSNTISLNTTQWHTYRILGVKTGGTWSLSLYVDGTLVSTATAASAAGSTIGWGDFSATGTAEGGTWDIDYVRWNDTKAIVPAPPPWYAYAQAGNVLPTAASPAWTANGSANSKFTVVGGSYLQMDSRDGSSPYYSYPGGTGTAWSLGSGLTVEMRAQVLDQTGSTAACSLWLGTGVEGAYLNLSTSSVTFGSQVIPLNVTQWHTYRITALKSGGDWTWTLNIDNSSQSYTYSGSTSGVYNPNRILVGDPGSAYGGRANIDYIRWNDKSAVPMRAMEIPFTLTSDMNGWTNEYQKWKVSNEALQQPAYFARTERIWLTTPTMGFSDVDASFEFMISSGNEGTQQAVGFLYGGQTSTNYNWVRFSVRDSEIAWYRSDAVKRTNAGVGTAAPGMTLDEWHTARIVKSGSSHSVYFDGQLVLTKADATLTDGAIGFLTDQAKASFRNLSINGTKVSIRSTFAVPQLPYFEVATNAGAGGYEGFPTIARAANGDLLCVFYAGYKHVPSGPDGQLPSGGRIALVRSTNNGMTWSQPSVVYDGAPTDDHDPRIARLSDGRLAVSICTYPVVGKHKPLLIWSSDNGHTWGNLQNLDAINPFSGSETPFSPIVELPDGTLLLATYGTVYASDTTTSVVVRRSTNGGQTWTWPSTALVKSNDPVDDPNIYEPNMAMMPGNRLIMVSRQKMFFNQSTDGGVTWSATQSMNLRGDAPYLLLTSQNVLLCGIRYRGDANGQNAGTALIYSLDYGVTWSAPVIISPLVGGYTSLMEMPDGRILVVYYTEGNSIGGEGSDIRGVFITANSSGITILP